jgi:hypothetical protein
MLEHKKKKKTHKKNSIFKIRKEKIVWVMKISLKTVTLKPKKYLT